MAKITNVVPRCLRFEDTPWEGTGFGLHGCWYPFCSHGPLFQPDCLTDCWRVSLIPAFGFFLNTALQVPLFWLSFILQRLVKTNLLCKASSTPHSPSLSSRLYHVHCLFQVLGSHFLVCDICYVHVHLLFLQLEERGWELFQGGDSVLVSLPFGA